MNVQIHIGDTAKTAGPLKPTGRISLNGETMDASSEGSWVDSDVEVVIVGGSTRRAIVRESSQVTSRLKNHGDVLPGPHQPTETPIQFPPARVEQANSVLIGLAIGIALVPACMLFGIPVSIYALLLPLSGVVTGWLFRELVGLAIHSAGPREDHRPRARAIALFVLLCCLVGGSIGFSIDQGFLGLSCGIPLGALAAGVLIYAEQMLSLLF